MATIDTGKDNNDEQKDERISMNCLICGSDGMISGVCESCQIFYSNYVGKTNEKCTCTDAVRSLSGNPSMCNPCRYKRCAVVLQNTKTCLVVNNSKATDSSPSSEANTKIDYAKLPCAVCGCSSTGYHFGVVACEGCKGFFRRSMKKTFKLTYKCKQGDSSEDNKTLCPSTSNCRKCRLKRCVEAGMTLNDRALGRRTVGRRAHVDDAIRRHLAQGSVLEEAVSRRKKAAAENSNQGGTNSRFCDKKEGPTESSSQVETPLAVNLSNPFSIPLANGYEENLDSGADERMQMSCDWLIKQSVEAAAKLSEISKMRLTVTSEMSMPQCVTEGTELFGGHVKCVSNFISALPGIGRVSLQDRIILFMQAFFPISAAQLSLNFDVEKQMPNIVSLDRQGPALNIFARELPTAHAAFETFLLEAGNRLVSVIRNMQEFSIFCALLLLNPATPNLVNADVVASVRYRYELALLHIFSNSFGIRSEQHLSDIYQLLVFFRGGTTIFRDLMSEMNARHAHYKSLWSPLFAQIHAEAINLSSSSTSTPQQGGVMAPFSWLS